MEHPLIRDLRQAGYRLTPQREAVIAVLGETHAHLTAPEILRRAQEHIPHLNKSAVYRALDVLTHLSLVNPIDLGKGEIQYELNCLPHHHHLVCQQCGKITDVGESVFGELEKILRTQYGFAPFLYHFAIFGICRACQPKVRRTRVSLVLARCAQIEQPLARRATRKRARPR
ncbi:MAG: transcriptional repressor [Chloroflexi bacterium]|nr:transcriptional repressor [Chloroflexota bacterium]